MTPLETIERIVERGGDADDVLRAVVASLHEDGGCAWAGIFFVEDGGLALGPEAGQPDEPTRISVPVVWQGDRIAELAADGASDRALLEQVAERIALHCLVGWDTGGEPWDD